MRPIPLRFAAFVCVALVLPSTTSAQPARADLILYNGTIITVDSADRIAQAVAIAGNRIVAVGTDADVGALGGPGTRRVDLKGMTVTPGLIDAHAHFNWGGADRLYVMDLAYPGVSSIAEVQAKIAEQVQRVPAGAFVQGAGWDDGKLAEKRMITAKDLDAVAPSNPVYLNHTTGHFGVANSVALRMANVTRDTPDPPGGTIDRNPDGTPTGVLKESAQGLVRRLIPPRSAAQVEEGMRTLARAFNAEGMTGVKDPGVSPAAFESYRKVLAEGALTVRVMALWLGGRNEAGAQRLINERAATTRPYESTGDDRLYAGGVKLYIDGSGGARTAWLYNDWNRHYTETDAGNRGYPTASADTIRRLIKLFHNAGMHVSVHSIGDRGIDWVVDSYVEALREKPTKGLRHGIIHANIPTDRAIDVIADLQRRYDAAYPEPSSTFTWWIGDVYSANFGPTRSPRLNPFATFESKGIIWANGSDFTVDPFPARYGIWASVARQPLLGAYGTDPFGRKEAASVRAALRSHTIWAARQMFLEQKVGSIEVGKYADLAIWDRDPYNIPTEELKDMKCLGTIFDGKVVYQAEGSVVELPRD